MFGLTKAKEVILGTHETLVQPIDMRAEMERRSTMEAKMLLAFQTQGELTTADLQRFGTGCSSRLFALRREGHVIAATYIKPGLYRYVYLGRKEDE